MLDKAIRHLVQREPDILEADFLADNVERRGRKTVVHRAHYAREHGAVADTGIEHTDRRRAWVNVGQFKPYPRSNFPFLRTGIHEQQVFLTIVEEEKIAMCIVACHTR